MSENKYYTGTNHIFENPYGDSVFIMPKPGQTLVIEGSSGGGPGEPDTSIQFNNAGAFGGDETMTFDSANKTLVVDNIDTKFIAGSTTSDNLGYSEIYRGPYDQPPQDIYSSGAAAFNFGADVSSTLLNDLNIFATANPHYVFGGSTGAVSVFQKDIGGTFTESQVISYTNFTLEKSIGSVSVNQDGNYLVYVDNSEFGYCYVYKLDGSTYTYLGENDPDPENYYFHYAKISNHNSDPDKLYCIACGLNSKYFTCLIDKTTGVFSDFADFVSGGSPSTQQYIPLQIHTYSIALYNFVDERLEVYVWFDLAGEYVLDAFFSIATLNSLDLKWDGNNTNSNTITYSTLGKYGIIKNGVEELTVNETALASCTNLTYCFFYSAGTIRIYKKVEGVWTQSENAYSIADVNHMSADNQYLYVSQTSANKGTVFRIESYSDHSVQITKIDMSIGTAGVIEVNAVGGVEFNSNELENFNNSTNGKIIVTDPAANSTHASLCLGSDSHGLSFADSVVNCVSGNQLSMTYSTASVKAKKRLWAEANFTANSGSLASPSIAFSSDVQTGFYLYDVSTIGVACGANAVMTFNPTISTWICPLAVYQNGSKDAPQYSFSGTATGLFKSTTYGGLAVTNNANHICTFTDETSNKPRMNLQQDGRDVYAQNVGGAALKIDNFSAGSQTRTGIEFDIFGETPTVKIQDFWWFQPSSSPTLVGNITTNGSSVSYNTTSDYRLKENVSFNEKAVENIQNLRPVKFNWKSSGKSDTGFLAHEFQEIYSQAVTGIKDGPDFQSMDSSYCISDLVRTVQTLLERVTVLENKLKNSGA